MVTFVFTNKNTSDVYYTSQFSENDAWTQLRDTLKDSYGWRLTEKVEEDDDEEAEITGQVKIVG